MDLSSKTLDYPHEYFQKIEEHDLDISKEHNFSKMKKDYPGHKEIERTDKIFKIFNIQNGKNLKQLHLRSDVILLADLFEKV